MTISNNKLSSACALQRMAKVCVQRLATAEGHLVQRNQKFKENLQTTNLQNQSELEAPWGFGGVKDSWVMKVKSWGFTVLANGAEFTACCAIVNGASESGLPTPGVRHQPSWRRRSRPWRSSRALPTRSSSRKRRSGSRGVASH